MGEAGIKPPFNDIFGIANEIVDANLRKIREIAAILHNIST